MIVSMQSTPLIVFDLGNVLVRLASGFADACACAGVGPVRGDAAAHHPLMCAFETGNMSEEEYFTRAIGCFDGLTIPQLRAIFDAWLLGPFSGTQALLENLKAKSIRTACLSNTNPPHWRTLLNNPVYEPLKLLDHHFASCDIRAAKPSPEAYRHVKQITGVSPADIVFFDDRDENVAAAISAGWKAHWIDPARDGIEQVVELLTSAGIL